MAAVLTAEILGVCIKILKFCSTRISGRGEGAWGNVCVPVGPGQKCFLQVLMVSESCLFFAFSCCERFLESITHLVFSAWNGFILKYLL